MPVITVTGLIGSGRPRSRRRGCPQAQHRLHRPRDPRRGGQEDRRDRRRSGRADRAAPRASATGSRASSRRSWSDRRSRAAEPTPTSAADSMPLLVREYRGPARRGRKRRDASLSDENLLNVHRSRHHGDHLLRKRRPSPAAARTSCSATPPGTLHVGLVSVHAERLKRNQGARGTQRDRSRALSLGERPRAHRPTSSGSSTSIPRTRSTTIRC